jgi:hypothetical protein
MRPNRFVLPVVGLCCIVTLAAAGGPQAKPAATVLAGRAQSVIHLDGRLDEPAWRDGSVVAELVQQSPRPGEATPYKTVLRVLILNETLYFGLSCSDPEPAKIAVHTLRRDGDFSGDDTISIVLDTYGDKRTGYFFRINAAGARADGLISDPQSASLDWDGIWDARTARTKTGWSAEIEIPARTLSFTAGLESWGLNFERFIPRDRTTLRWVSATLDAFLYDLSRAGSLAGVSELEQGKGLEFSPYTTGRAKDSFGGIRRAWQGAAGVDINWRFRPQMAAVLTANTDFAETEVDNRQINLTRFPLFFPEKRAFFLEGANQFNFGLRLSDSFIPFFTRRVGLVNARQVPIDAGVKLNGREGKWNVALLDVQTRDTDPTPGTNLFAGRVSYDASEELRVGTVFTNGDPQGLGRNSLAGFDTVWRTSKFRDDKNLLLGGWTAFTAGDLGKGRRTGWGVAFDYPNDLLACYGSINDFGDGFTAALGFLPRPGTRQYSAGCAYQPRPSKSGPFGWIRQQFFENEYSRVTDSKGVNESWEYFMAPVNVRLESGDRFEFNWSPRYEFLAAPFEISPGVVIPPGSYNFTRWRLEAQTSPHRPWAAGTTTWFGTFYDGHLTQWQNYAKWTSPRGKMQLGLTAENDFARLKEGTFIQRLWQLNFGYAWSPNLALTSLVQYDTESQDVGANTRLRWTIKPGDDLFIVWNRGWRRLLTGPHDLSLAPENQMFAVKLRWTFRR